MARYKLERVVWSEGMPLCPQHLQQHDNFVEGLVGARIATLTPYDWGVIAMTIDTGELSSGTFRLQSFTGILSGGLPLDLAGGEPGLPVARPLGEHFSSTTTTLEVFIAVPSSREGIPNVGDASPQSRARYHTSTRQVPDMTAAKTEQVISFGRANTVLLFGSESREDFESIKIAEVVRDATGHYQLSPNYIPPSHRISANAVLPREMQDLLAVMLSKQRSLAETRRQVDAASVEFTGQDITRFLLLNALSTNIPVIRHIVDTQSTSPLDTYLALLQLGGALSTFSGDVDPSTFPLYQHNDLRSTFEPLLAVINKMLGATIKERCIIVPLEARKDGMWIGQLKDDRLPRCPQFVLAVDAQSSQQDTANRLPQISKIASWKEIGQIVRSATPGVQLSVTHRPPPEVPVRPKIVYFMLKTDEAYWRSITTERAIALYLPPPFDPSKATITLMGIPERGA